MKRAYGWLIRTYNRVIRLRWINKNNPFCRRVRAMLFHNICTEHEAYFGNLNPNEHFYVIRCPQENMGLFAVINYVVFHLKIADNKGYSPVVDWQYYPNKYFSQDDEVGKVNVWESFFEQTTKVSLNDVYRSSNVTMSSGSWDAAAIGELKDTDTLRTSHKIFSKYVHLNKEMKTLIEQEASRIGFSKKRMLAVKIRGTDFITTHPEDHSRVSGVYDTVDVISRKSEEWGEFDGIYLATEDRDVLEKMKQIYGDRLYYTDAITYTCDEVGSRWLGDCMDSGRVDKTAAMKEYLISTYMLTYPDYLIAPAVGGTVGALRIKGAYKGICII